MPVLDHSRGRTNVSRHYARRPIRYEVVRIPGHVNLSRRKEHDRTARAVAISGIIVVELLEGTERRIGMVDQLVEGHIRARPAMRVTPRERSYTNCCCERRSGSEGEDGKCPHVGWSEHPQESLEERVEYGKVKSLGPLISAIDHWMGGHPTGTDIVVYLHDVGQW